MNFTADLNSPLTARRLGVDTHQELTIYLRDDSPVVRSEGFAALSRVRVRTETDLIIATLHIITGNTLLQPGEIGFSEAAWQRLRLLDGQHVWADHPRPMHSIAHIRAKVYGHTLTHEQYAEIIGDIVAGHYADVHLAAFITACGDDRMTDQEISDLTRAMIAAGSTLSWPQPVVVDKHCVGGLPGNRTTPIVVSILTACGLTMPKTSSRAITSPAGTADTMETLTNVSLTLKQMRAVVKQEGGCFAWGGAMHLSPADDLLIKVERALDIDSEGQLIASVLSKKIAAGATHVVIDMPVGPTAKVRSQEAAEKLGASFNAVATKLGIKLKVIFSDGLQPVGRGIGPALEARDILAVLQNRENAPADLRERSICLAGAMLEMVKPLAAGEGQRLAGETLASGDAWRHFQAICQAQGGLKSPPVAPFRYELLAPCSGTLKAIDNRKLSRAAKLAGAPGDPAAGIELHLKLGERINRNEPLLTLHAESAGELNYAVSYLDDHPDILALEPDQEIP